MTSDGDLLFVYGSLRPAFDGDMARWLAAAARHLGSAWASGRLYRLAGYPGFVPEGEGRVAGDLFSLPDPAPLLAVLDAFEECSEAFPEPCEYRRERLVVEGPQGPVRAWAYVYARPVDALALIPDGDFLG